MPKDWEIHKAEIERLYMVERRPLNDVRNILRTQFAFDASIRAYRMKLDDWRLWKNNSKNDRRAAKTGSRRHQSPPAMESSDSEDPIPNVVTVIQPPPPADLPMAPSDFGQLSAFSKTIHYIVGFGFPPAWELEQILKEWKSDGSYLEGTLKNLDDKRSRFCIHWRPFQGTTLFQSIAATVAPFETYPLAKRCLEIDFEQAKERNLESPEWELPEPPEWFRLWRTACASHKWEEVVKHAHMIDDEPEGPGPLFTSAALPFLGEKLLERNLEQLESWDPGDNQFKPCLQESMIILNSFKIDVFDVDKIWYKRFLQLSQSHIAQARGPDQLDDYRKSFLKLRTLHDSIDQSEDPVQNLLSAANVLKESKAILAAPPGEDVSHAEDGVPIVAATPAGGQPETSSKAEVTVQTLIEDLYKKWSWGKKIKKQLQILLKHLKQYKSNPMSPEENIFILLSRIIPRKDRTCFLVAILTDLDTVFPIIVSRDRLSWDSWLVIHDTSTLEKLRKHVCLTDELHPYFQDGIGTNAVYLVLDAFTIFAGYLTLSDLRNTIIRRYIHEEDYDLPRADYMAILDKLQARGLQVHQNWYEFLGRMLCWKTSGDFFLSTVEESDVSDDDSTDSEEGPDVSDDGFMNSEDETMDEGTSEVIT